MLQGVTVLLPILLRPASALTPRVPAVTPRVTPRPMLSLCNSDLVTTLAYVTRGPAAALKRRAPLGRRTVARLHWSRKLPAPDDRCRYPAA